MAILGEVAISGIPDAGGSALLFRAGTSARAAMLVSTLIAAIVAAFPGLTHATVSEAK